MLLRITAVVCSYSLFIFMVALYNMAMDGFQVGDDEHRLAGVKFDLVAFVFFGGIPFKCKDDVIHNNTQVQLCHVGAEVEPKNVSIFEGS